MFAPVLQRIRSLAARGADWQGRLGPVAIFGADSSVTGSSESLLKAFRGAPADTDFYCQLVHHDTTPIEAPSMESPHLLLPTLHIGELKPTAVESSPSPRPEDWYVGIREATSEVLVKGYIPFLVGGNNEATLPMVESIKGEVPDEDVVLFHFSAFSSLGDASHPASILLQKGAVRGVFQLGGRVATMKDRKVRKEQKVLYIDTQNMFSRPVGAIRDIRNDYPVFISFDMNVLDPVFAPGQTKCEAGGLTTREVLHVLKGIRAPRIVGVHLHGYDPQLDVYRRDGVGLSQITAAKIIKELIFKCLSVSTVTEQEGFARVQAMQASGQLGEDFKPK